MERGSWEGKKEKKEGRRKKERKKERVEWVRTPPKRNKGGKEVR